MNHAINPKQFSEIVAEKRRHTDGDAVAVDPATNVLAELDRAGYVIVKKPPIDQFRNKSLIDVDPYDPNLSDMRKLQIIEECKVNPWYFYYVLGKPSAPETES